MDAATISAREIIGRELIDPNGSRVGTVGQLYLDDQTNEPEWVTVTTGLLGTKESFVPVADTRFDGERLSVPFPRDRIKDAPNVSIDADGHLSQEDEATLYAYYGLTFGAVGSKQKAEAVRTGTDEAMTRSEQRLQVDKERVPAGQSRLRKWIETEEVTVTVPLARARPDS